MSYGLSTKAVGAPIGAGLRNRLAQPVKYIPLSHFFTQTGDEMEKYGIVGYADREEWGMLDPKEAARGSKPVKAERETTKDLQKMKGVKKRAQKSPDDEEEPEESQDGDDEAKAAEGEPDAKTDEKEAAADSEAEPETGPEDDSGGTDDSGDEDEDEKKPAKKKKSGEEDDEEIDTEKNNPYLKHPFPSKEKSQEGASAPGNMLAEAQKRKLTKAEKDVLRFAQENPRGYYAAVVGSKQFQAMEKLFKKGLMIQVGGDTVNEPYTAPTSYGRQRVNMGMRRMTQIMGKLTPEGRAVDLTEERLAALVDESGGPLLPVKAGATRALTGATGTGNIATAAVPIGAGDGRKFLDRPGKRKKKPRRLSGQLYILLRP